MFHEHILFLFQTDPKRLKKELPKQMKGVKADDRLLLVGTSRCPFDGEMKPLTSLYGRIILIPRPDYASRHCEYLLMYTAYREISPSIYFRPLI